MSNLWIRSQNRETLIKVNYVSFKEYRENTKFPYHIEYGGFSLGHYETKERALEVLDEIQFLILHNYNVPDENAERMIKAGAIISVRKNVYEMPEQ